MIELATTIQSHSRVYGWHYGDEPYGGLFYLNTYYQPALIREENGIWNKPETLDFEWCWELGERDRYRLSGDGNIIAAQDTVEVRGGVSPNTDVYLLTKTSNDKWEQHKINPDGTLVIPDIYLTGDGSKLFRLTKGKSSVPGALKY